MVFGSFNTGNPEDLGQLCGDLAIVDRRAPAAQSALQGHAALRSRGENQVEAVPVLDSFPVVLRKRDVVVGRVLNSGGLMLYRPPIGIAAAGQPRIARRGDAEHVEVARGPRAVVDDVEVSVDAARK